jgi:hypothetical protein
MAVKSSAIRQMVLLGNGEILETGGHIWNALTLFA